MLSGWRELLYRAQQGDPSAMEEMVEGNVGLIHMVLKHLGIRGSRGGICRTASDESSWPGENYGRNEKSRGSSGVYGCYDREDLFQIGAIGLIHAIQRFDLHTDYSFSTYAVPMILGEIRRFLRDDGMIHVGRRIKENALQIAHCKERFLREQNHEPTVGELAQATGLSGEDIVLALGASASVESIQRPMGTGEDEKGETLEDLLADEVHTDERFINRIAVQHLLSTLPENERSLVMLRYMEGRTQAETAECLGTTQVNVSRLEKKILGKLRSRMCQ